MIPKRLGVPRHRVPRHLGRCLLATITLLASSAWGSGGTPPDAPFPPQPPRSSRGLSNGTFPVQPDGQAEDGAIIVAPSPARPLRLAILPDRTSGRDWGLPYLKAAVADLNRIRPDAVFGIGDMVQGYTRSTRLYDEETATYLAILDALEPVFYPATGNHDVVPGTRDPADGRFVDRYRRTFGPVRYAVEFDLATVVVLFTDEASGDGEHRLGEAQRAWLEATLARAAKRERPIIVLLHRPLWRSASSRWSELVQPLLERSGVDAVIAGHLHSMQRDPDIGGIPYYILGTCGGMIDQHPYAGQWQHLTFIDVSADGKVSIHHQPVGVTVDGAFVRAEDQDRAYRLKEERRVVQVSEAVDDPLRGAIESRITVRCTNPIDVPIKISMETVTAPPGTERVEGLPFTTEARRDSFNPFVTDVATPFRLELPAPFTLAPGETAERTITVRCPRTDPAPRPPELAITARFTDSQGRSVPVWMARRLPIQREIPLSAAVDPAFPIASWVPSPYDTLEPDPTCRISLEGERLRIDLEVPDRDRPDDLLTPASGSRRVTDPPHDAIRILLPDGPKGQREFLIEPFARGPGSLKAVGHEGRLEEVAGAEVDTSGTDEDAWRISIRMPPLRPSPGDRINIGVADNDWTYHTQWRWLAPEAFPARFTVPVAPP